MKRMLAAIALAILVHGLLFLLDSDWFQGRSVPPRVSQFVTVTMSYRQKAPEAERAEKKEDGAAQEEAEPKKVETPKSRQKPIEKPVEQKPAEVIQPEERKAAGDEKVSDAVSSTRDSSSDAGLVQEAIPLYKINPPPRYPKTARRRGIQGTVVLSVYVDTQGRVANLWVFESSGYRVLDNAALEAVKKWSFEPGRRGETPVAMWVNVPVRFELQ
jgi:protein TonB